MSRGRDRGRADRIRPVRERGTEGDRHKNEPPPRDLFTRGKLTAFIQYLTRRARREEFHRPFPTNISNSRLSSACFDVSIFFVQTRFFTIFFNFVVKVNYLRRSSKINSLFDLFFQVQRFIRFILQPGLITDFRIFRFFPSRDSIGYV